MINKNDIFDCPVCNVKVGPYSRGITFHARQHNLTFTLEVARFCTKLNHSVSGALGKLTKTSFALLQKSYNISQLLSYVDNRFGGDKTYESANWKYYASTGPRFWWTDTIQRYDRFKIRAKDGVSEKEIAKNNRMFKIWGCNNDIFLFS